MSIQYRPEIDGLRAVAVLSVFVFHLDPEWLPGGFVGVDIFFVISGYLITSIIYRDLLEGQFNFRRFYQRRIARIFPALFIVALAIVAAASAVYTPQDLSVTAGSFIAAALSLANMKYIFHGNYFEISPDARPFLHYWSLSVEEQFYILYPLLLVLIFRYARRYLVASLVLLGAGSFLLCIGLTQVKPVWAFYLLPTRMWELCAGCLLAVIPFSANRRWSRSLFEMAPLVGLLLIGLSVILLEESTQFPGWQAAMPVVGAVAFIFPGSDGRGIVKRAFSHPVLVGVGKLSYSLYLWHWPVFSMIDYRFFMAPDWARLMAKISLTFLLTFMTYRFIENPSRRLLNRPGNRRIAFAGLALVLVASVPYAWSIRQTNYISADRSDLHNGGIYFPAESGEFSVVLMGDSNASMYTKTLREICSDLGADLYVMSVDGATILPAHGNGQKEELWYPALEAVRRIEPDYLILAHHWSAKIVDNPDRLRIALTHLKPHTENIILLDQPPTLPVSAWRAAIREGAELPFREPDEINAKRKEINTFLSEMRSEKISVLDISRHFQRQDGSIRLLGDKRLFLFQDATHLSAFGTEKIRERLEVALTDR